jgi:hypothetical protein
MTGIQIDIHQRVILSKVWQLEIVILSVISLSFLNIYKEEMFMNAIKEQLLNVKLRVRVILQFIVYLNTPPLRIYY